MMNADATRIIRIHQNGRTLFSWWTFRGYTVGFDIQASRLEIDFNRGEVRINGALAYRFKETLEPPKYIHDFHALEFLFDNTFYRIEYRREE